MIDSLSLKLFSELKGNSALNLLEQKKKKICFFTNLKTCFLLVYINLHQ